jgi:S1-C subfamily serine protease
MLQRLLVLPLVLLLPLLCLFSVIMRLVLREKQPRVRAAWNSWLNTLLAASGILTTLAFTMVLFVGPKPVRFTMGIYSLDAVEEFPQLPSEAALNARQLSSQVDKLLFVATPVPDRWPVPQNYLDAAAVGASFLFYANEEGFLLATNRHVVDGLGWAGAGNDDGQTHMMVFAKSGDYAQAEVIARHKELDVAVLWVPRSSGDSTFAQPILPFEEIPNGQDIFVLGHPQRLFFSISDGIVMRRHNGQQIQISAPVSPGNSGGPVYDDRGYLLGVVNSKVDRTFTPNAENLNFAIRADTLLDVSGWNFRQNGQERLQSFIDATNNPAGPAEESPAE